MESSQPVIKEGYKRTDVGIIPEDWEVHTLGELCEYQNGTSQEQYFNSIGGLRVISIGNYSSAGRYIDNNTFIADEFLEKVKRFVLNKDDLTMILNDKTSAGTILGRVLLIPSNNAFVFNQRTMRLISREKVLSIYLYHLINSGFVHSRIVSLAKPGTQIYINTGDVTTLAVPIPPTKEEQQAIAEVLSDVNALITSLDQLIDKRRKVKQGTMQLLLTGKKRLPGFSGDWKTKTLEEVTDCLDNLRVPLNEAQRAKMQGDIPYCGANGVLDYINEYAIDDDIILIAEDGGYFDEYLHRPIAYRMSGRCWVNNHAHILKSKEGINQNFVFYSLVHKNILRFLASGTRAKLNKSEMYKIEIDIPEIEDEQTAIAQILNDMDAEIEALEKKRDKHKAIKQGMMQELLTGKTRLV